MQCDTCVCRSAVDLCHRDGSLKREVAANPSRYIHEVGGWGVTGVIDGGVRAVVS